MPKQKKIKIECTGTDTLELDQLMDFQGNLKKLSEKNLEKLKKRIIKSFDAPFFIWKKNSKYFCLDGHQRRQALISLREDGYLIPPLPVCYVKAKTRQEAKEKLLGIASQYGQFDKEGIFGFIEDLEIDFKDNTYNLVDINYNIDFKEFIDKEEEAKIDDAIPEQVKAITKKGDLWELGNHRLLCGDCKKNNNIQKLLNQDKIDLIFTDPPYGINIVKPKKNNIGFVGAGGWVPANAYKPIIGDNKKFDPTPLFSISDKYILWGGNYYLDKLTPTSCWIIWDKREDIPSNNFADCEMAWTNLNRPARIYRQLWSGLLRKGNRKDEGQKRLHPTQKPVGLFVDILIDFSKEDWIVGDLYLGSGSTIIACEKINRTCFAMEIDEHYCDVTVMRYIDWCYKNNKRPEIKLNGQNQNPNDLLK